MKRLFHRLVAVWTSLTLLAGGCVQQRYQFHKCCDFDGYYTDVATAIEEPDIDGCTLDEVRFATKPLTLQDFEDHKIWELSLEEATQIALANSRILRLIGPIGAFRVPSPVPDNLTRAPEAAPSVYGPALQESNPVFIGQGVEAALSEFDAQLTSSMFWERNNRPINRTAGNPLFSTIFQQDRGVFSSEVAKTAATGSRFFARHNVQYDYNNNPARDVPSNFDLNVEFGAVQPLLQRAGVQFNRITGPNGQVGVYNGVAIARINEDLSLADFEGNVRNVLSDLERTYRQLYFMYRRKDIAKEGRDRAHRAWQEAKAAGNEISAAQAETEFFRFRGALENGLRELFATENRLRYLMGIAASDGRLIRPCDEPTTAKINFDWCEIHLEANARSIELRRQRWKVQQKELELIAAKNFVLPQLDAVALYRFLGAGDDLYHSNGRGLFPYAGSDAYSSLFTDDFEEWQLGLQFSMPLGFRRELSAVRHAQLQVAREKALLQDEELEISHQLAEAVRNLESHYVLAQTNFNRWSAAKHELELIDAARPTKKFTDYTALLNAYGKLVNAEEDYFESLLLYNLAIIEVHFRKGSLLDYNGVYLAEGPWPCKAYSDARKRACERCAACPVNYAMSRPAVFSRGPAPYDPHCAENGMLHEGIGGPAPSGESVPAREAPATSPLPPPPAPKSNGEPKPGPTTAQSPFREIRLGGGIDESEPADPPSGTTERPRIRLVAGRE
ncbi:MAG: TolC family protein [Planctomycetia bacterium]|nr:TolC family protein [Planctomycetia bacterium]